MNPVIGYIMILSILMMKMVPANLSVNGPSLFHKDSKLDKLVLSNQIGYHFRRVVREVSQELFIARKIDVSALFLGMEILKQTQIGLETYCSSLAFVTLKNNQTVAMPKSYVHIPKPEFASFPEANARCRSLGMQLPELYNEQQRKEFTTFLKNRNIKRVFAGIQPDVVDTIHRFVSTGIPLWQTPHQNIQDSDGKVVRTKYLLDDMHAEFLYTNNNELMVVWENPNVFGSFYRVGDSRFREKVTGVTQYVMPIVCEPVWNGSTYADISVKPVSDDIDLKPRIGRSVYRDPMAKKAFDSSKSGDTKGLLSLKQYCFSIATQSGEIEQELIKKMKDLLSLVDISVQMDHLGRNKRSPFLAKYMFFNGARLIWTIYGFIQRMRMSARIGRLEENLSETQSQVNNNSLAISNMSLTLYGHSIAIQTLRITTADLEKRLSLVERKMENLEISLFEIINKVETVVSLSLISSLILRIQQSLNSGYSILKDIIHCSLLGQTSPLLLPFDQIKIVQNEVQKVSTALLDTNFAKMQSVVVSDPQDPHLLLVVINAAALNRRNVELIKLVAVPYFEGSKSYSPVLDYNTILLDHLDRTYSILSEQEEYDCLSNRCYVSDIEHSVNEKTCGIPQWFNQHLDVCVLQETLSDGVFLKPMLPDGVLFAFKEEVITQLFCKDNNPVGPIRKLNGTGTIQLPNGCLLSVTDKQGRNTKVKGQPLYRMINAEDLDLTINGPLGYQHAIKSLNESHRLMIHGVSVSDHLSSVVRQVETVDLQLRNQTFYIWLLIAVVITIVVAAILFTIIAYQHRGKFYFKIHELRDRFLEIRQAILETERARAQGLHPYSVPDHLLTGERSQKPTTNDEFCEGRKSASYVTLGEVAPKRNDVAKDFSFRPIKPNNQIGNRNGFYPSITPLFDQLSDVSSRVDHNASYKPFQRPKDHII